MTEESTHVDNLPWYVVPLPRPWHRCKAQTVGAVDGVRFERCPCGAVRYEGTRWRHRNAERAGRRGI